MTTGEPAVRNLRSQHLVSEALLALHGRSLANDYRRRALWTWIERRLPTHGRVLDAGCGTGFMTRELARRGHDVTAVDADGELARFAQDIVASEGLHAAVHQVPLGEGRLGPFGSFDGILCLDVIEHIEDDAAALEELRESLGHDGVLLLGVPAMPSLYGKRDEALGHYRRYDRRMLLDLCQRSRLHVHELRYWNALGVPFYFVYEHLLGRPIDDRLRSPSPKDATHLSALTRQALVWLLQLESLSPVAPPAGLSLLAVCRR